MVCSGKYLDINLTCNSKVEYDLILDYAYNKDIKIYLGLDGSIVSAYKIDGNKRFAYKSKLAESAYKYIKLGIGGATPKNGTPVPFKLGASSMHYFKKQDINFEVQKFNGLPVYMSISKSNFNIVLNFNESTLGDIDLDYVELKDKKENLSDISVDDISVRSLEEIALEKDLSWLKDKKYYIVNDEETAERLFVQLEKYKGTISFDTETTGLKINMFGRYGSKRRAELAEYNLKNPENQIKTDSLVGIIYCVEPNVSYYFPVGHRKFSNLYSNKSDLTLKIINNIKSRYTIGDLRETESEYAKFIRELQIEDFTPDIVLMERNRDILTRCNILAHNGSFEYKVCCLYDIDLNLKDDSMLLHQLMYKFRSTTSNKGEPSNLKYLTKVEFGVDQLDLKDFFTDYKEDNKGTVRNNKNKSNIDFSYMEYDGTKAYAPADGDFTLQIYFKYIEDLKKNFKEMEYIYNVEVIVSMAIGYMEFHGLRINEYEIERTRDKYKYEMLILEHKIRNLANLSSQEEDSIFNEMTSSNSQDEGCLSEIQNKLRYVIDSSDNKLNLDSPMQVSNLLYNVLNYPSKDGDTSVGKKVIDSLTKAKNEDGSLKYPVAKLYREYKDLSSLITKFFGKLQDFMYPGGFFFSSFGQISTATGRMSCSRPNSQQLPKSVTKIIIPRDNFITVDADFSQIEYRTLVALAKEDSLIESFKDPDSDYHTTMASLMYQVPYASVNPEMRSSAKSFNFGIPYGMGFKSLSILLFGDSTNDHVAKAMELYELYFKDQPSVRKFFDTVKEIASIYKFNKTYFNRRRYYSFEDVDGNFSQKKKAMALRQAGNFCIQGSAADIFKIAVARNFLFIRNNNLFGKLLITNMVHDEMLFELDCDYLNIKKCLSEIIKNMQFNIDGFPPLYVGAGVALSWGEAKGKMAEIHPKLANIYISETNNESLFDSKSSNKDIKQYFDNRVFEFRVSKVKEYILDSNNYNKPIEPSIGNLLGLQFDFGVNKEFDSKYNEENGYLKDEIAKFKKDIPLEQLKRFIENYNLDVDFRLFQGIEIDNSIEEDVAYDESDETDTYDEEAGGVFVLIDEDSARYGISVVDLIKQFGLIVSKELSLCGIDLTKVNLNKKQELIKLLEEHECLYDDNDSLNLVFLNHNNILNRTNIYVKDLTTSAVASRLGINTLIA